MSLRIKLDLTRDDLASGEAFARVVEHTLLTIPVFPWGPVSFRLVVADTAMTVLAHTPAPPPYYSDRSEEDVLSWAAKVYAKLGLLGFVSDDKDETQEAELDAKTLDMLRAHPAATNRGGYSVLAAQPVIRGA